MFHLVGLGEVDTMSEVFQRVLSCRRVEGLDIGPLTLLHGYISLLDQATTSGLIPSLES